MRVNAYLRQLLEEAKKKPDEVLFIAGCKITYKQLAEVLEGKAPEDKRLASLLKDVVQKLVKSLEKIEEELSPCRR